MNSSTTENLALSIICPVYCEDASLEPFIARLLPVLQETGEAFEIVFVNDGSHDGTLEKLLELQKDLEALRIIDLSRNFGKEAALTCGIDHALGAAVIPIDVDLQDPPELILDMVRLWHQGFDVVLAQRTDRSTDSVLKRKTAEWYYHLHNAIAQTPIPPNIGDYRLMSRKVVDALQQMPERNRFMKGLFAWVGFRQATIPYVREARIAGQSKFSGWKLWNFAVEGITSFSTAPLHIWTYIGSAIALISFIYGIFIIGATLINGRDLPGYASLMTVILFLGGIQLVGLGTMGEYIGRIYIETKGRPVYIVRDRYDNNCGRAS